MPYIQYIYNIHIVYKKIKTLYHLIIEC